MRLDQERLDDFQARMNEWVSKQGLLEGATAGTPPRECVVSIRPSPDFLIRSAHNCRLLLECEGQGEPLDAAHTSSCPVSDGSPTGGTALDANSNPLLSIDLEGGVATLHRDGATFTIRLN